jgi:hypothetical protein
VTSRATCRGTWTCGVSEVIDDEPRDVPKQPDARRRKIDSALTGARRLASMDLGESTSRLILLMRVLQIRLVVMITPTWRANRRCFRPVNLPRGVPEVVDCAVRNVIGRARTRRCAQGHRTQDYTGSGRQGGESYVLLGDQVWRPALGVGLRSSARLGTRASFI